MRVVLSVCACLMIQFGFAQGFVLVKNQQDLLSQALYDFDHDNNVIWLGTSQGISSLEIREDSVVKMTNRTTSKPVLSLCDYKKYLWVGIQGKGLYLFNKSNYLFRGMFKAVLGKKDLVNIEKIKEELIIYTDRKEIFVVNLTDTTVRLVNDDQLERYEAKDNHKMRDTLLFRSELYKLSNNGLLIFKESFAADTPVQEKKTSVNVAGELFQEQKLVPSSNASITKESEALEDAAQFDDIEKDLTSELEGESNYFWLVFLPCIGLYTVVLIKVVSRKLKKDIKVLEDELLKIKQ